MVERGRGFLVRAGDSRPTRVPQPTTHYKAMSADTQGTYTFGEHELVLDFPLHVHHREDECLYLVEGRLTAVVGEDTFSLGPGDCVFMPRGVPHALTGVSDPPPRFVFVSTPGGFEHLMDDFVEVAAKGHGPGSPEWSAVEARHDLKFL